MGACLSNLQWIDRQKWYRVRVRVRISVRVRVRVRVRAGVNVNTFSIKCSRFDKNNLFLK